MNKSRFQSKAKRERTELALTVLSVIKTRPAILALVNAAMDDEIRRVQNANAECRTLIDKIG